MQTLPPLLEISVVMNAPEVACLGTTHGGGRVIESEVDASISSSIEVVLSLLGDDAKQALIFHIAERFNLDQGEFSANPDVLGRALARFFGTGAQVIENKILQEMNDRCKEPAQRDFAKTLVLATRIELSIRGKQHERARIAGQD